MSNTEKIIRLKTVLDRTGLSRSTLYRKIAEGTFPPQVRISVHGAGLAQICHQWLDRRSCKLWAGQPNDWRKLSGSRVTAGGQSCLLGLRQIIRPPAHHVLALIEVAR